MEALMSNLTLQFRESPLSISQQTLNDLLNLSLDLKIRESFTYEQIDILKCIACYCIDVICTGTGAPSNEQLAVLVLVFKLLRNLCAQVKRNQNQIGQTQFLDELKRFILWNNDNFELYQYGPVVACLTQLIGNICVTNDSSQGEVWYALYPIAFKSLLSMNSSSIFEATCMVIFNCIRGNAQERMKSLFVDTDGTIISLILNSLKTLKESGTEWAVLVLEELLSIAPLSTLCHSTLSSYPRERVSLLEFLLAYCDELGVPDSSREDEESLVADDEAFLLRSKAQSFFQSVLHSHSNLHYLMDQYQLLVTQLLFDHKELLASLQCIESTYRSLEDSAVITLKHLVSVLGLLCQSSSCHSLLQVIQEKESLILHSSIDFLSSLSKLDGSLESARNVSHSSFSSSSDLTAHPLYGIKSDLVRLIGNLCYQCKKNQDQVHDSIPLLLNQCNIDHMNPYIQQWSLWAIRNICEGNPANQEIIRNIEKRGNQGEGSINVASQLEDSLGCEVEIDKNGKLRLKKKKS